MSMHQVLIGGRWQESINNGSFQAEDPQSATPIADEYPVSSWQECEAALDAAVSAWETMRGLPVERGAIGGNMRNGVPRNGIAGRTATGVG